MKIIKIMSLLLILFISCTKEETKNNYSRSVDSEENISVSIDDLNADDNSVSYPKFIPKKKLGTKSEETLLSTSESLESLESFSSPEEKIIFNLINQKKTKINKKEKIEAKTGNIFLNQEQINKLKDTPGFNLINTIKRFELSDRKTDLEQKDLDDILIKYSTTNHQYQNLEVYDILFSNGARPTKMFFLLFLSSSEKEEQKKKILESLFGNNGTFDSKDNIIDMSSTVNEFISLPIYMIKNIDKFSPDIMKMIISKSQNILLKGKISLNKKEIVEKDVLQYAVGLLKKETNSYLKIIDIIGSIIKRAQELNADLFASVQKTELLDICIINILEINDVESEKSKCLQNVLRLLVMSVTNIEELVFNRDNFKNLTILEYIKNWKRLKSSQRTKCYDKLVEILTSNTTK
jgi:hypothetical protein